MNMPVPGNSQEPIRQLLDDSRKFLLDNKVATPFDIETMFTVVGKRIRAGNYPDDLLFRGQEKEVRSLYYLLDLAGNKSTLNTTDLSHYGLQQPPSKAIEKNARTEADTLHARWQELMDNLSIDYGLRVTECSPPSKQDFARVAEFERRYSEEVGWVCGKLGPFYQDTGRPNSPEGREASPLNECVEFLDNIILGNYDGGGGIISAEKTYSPSAWYGSEFVKWLPRGDETMERCLQLIDRIRASSPALSQPVAHELDEIQNTLYNLKEAYIATGITAAIPGTGPQQKRTTIDVPQSSPHEGKHGSSTGDVSQIDDVQHVIPSSPHDENDMLPQGGDGWAGKIGGGLPGKSKGKKIR